MFGDNESVQYWEITFCCRACQILIFNVIPVEVGWRGENIPKTLSLQILPKTITSLSQRRQI